MKAIARAGSTRGRVHVAKGLRPLCGGGKGARLANWQWDLGDHNCKRCKAILERSKSK